MGGSLVVLIISVKTEKAVDRTVTSGAAVTLLDVLSVQHFGPD